MYKIKIEQCQDPEIGPADSEEDRNISFSRSGESRGNAIAVKFGVRLVEVKLVKKATKNGVPPNLGDSWPRRGPVQHGRRRVIERQKRKFILKQVSQISK